MAMSRVYKSRAPAEEMGIAVVEESRKEAAKIRMKFEARWQEIDSDGGRVGGSGGMRLMELDIAKAKAALASGITDHQRSHFLQKSQDRRREKAFALLQKPEMVVGQSA
jgi:hypothetical protein